MTLSADAQRAIDHYLVALRKHLRDLMEEDVNDIVQEIKTDGLKSSDMTIPPRARPIGELDVKIQRASYLAARAGAASIGRTMEKAVPVATPKLRERTPMVPPCLSTICLVTHRPRPVPTAPLVVKNGSKR